MKDIYSRNCFTMSQTAQDRTFTPAFTALTKFHKNFINYCIVQKYHKEQWFVYGLVRSAINTLFKIE